MKRVTDFLKKMINIIIGKEQEKDLNCQAGLGIAIADDILDYLGHGDLGGDIDSIRFYSDDPKIVGFLESKSARDILTERLKRERIPERLTLAEGISRGWISVGPLNDAPKEDERTHRVKNMAATVRYEVFRRTSNADCRITVDGMKPFLLSEKVAICGQYPFGRESASPKRENSFVLPDSSGRTSRTQGAFVKNHGNWSVIQHVSRPKMKVNGITLDADQSVELFGKGKIDIKGYQIEYEIVEQ